MIWRWPELDPVIGGLVLGGIAWASWTDVRTGFIRNHLTVSMMLAGLMLHLAYRDPLVALAGAGLAMAIHYPLWALGIEKAGDAKLIMGVGALLGWRDVAELSAWYAVLYLPIGLLVLVVQGRLGNLVAVARHQAAKAAGQDPGPAPTPTPLRTAPVIAAATLGALVTEVHWVLPA
jgi:Flp pilus assembly protein protease CpaA